MHDLSPPKPSKLAPPSVYLLAEHLDAALAAGEDLMGVRFATPAQPHSREEIEAARLGQRTAAERIRTFELALVSRLLAAREWAAKVGSEEPQFSSMARLYVSGTATLLDAVQECSDISTADFAAGDTLFNYVKSRCLVVTSMLSLRETAPIAADERFLVAKRAPLGVLLDLAAAFLDALEAEFDLFEAEGGDGRPVQTPAAELTR
jgi:hypothetical protein